jgi:hypothetical protein
LKLELIEISTSDMDTQCVLNRRAMILRTDSIPDKSLTMTFSAADTEELRNVSFTFQGDRAIFKVGEGELNHY